MFILVCFFCVSVSFTDLSFLPILEIDQSIPQSCSSPLGRQQMFQDYKSPCPASVAIKLKKLYGLPFYSQLVTISLNVYQPESIM